MRHPDLFGLALGAIRAQRQRSLLTILGIAVGIATVVLLTAVGEGVRQYIKGEFTQFGTNLIGVKPGKTSTFGMSSSAIASVRPLTVDDAQALYRIHGVLGVVPTLQGNAQVEYGERSRRTTVIGVGHDMPAVWSMRVALGQFLPPDPFSGARAFAVLGARMRDELFGTENPLGARIRVGTDRFRVIGAMAPKGQMLGFDLDDTLFLPIGKATELFNRDGLIEIDIVYDKQSTSDQIAAGIRRILLARHGKEDFTLVTQDKMLEVLDSILTVLTAGIAAIGAISLVVGAVGISTIMTIVVTERTAEIGLLRALGTRRGNVLGLFLTEAIALGTVGGLCGIGFALSVIGSLQLLLPSLPLQISWPFTLGALLLAVVIGVGAGLLPAARAARLDPIEALRAE